MVRAFTRLFEAGDRDEWRSHFDPDVVWDTSATRMPSAGIYRGHEGIETAVVWRGVPAAVDFHRFVWEGLDGSAVVAEYLPAGYDNAAYLFDVPGPVDLRLFAERFSPWFRGDPVLGMVGTDHMPLAPAFSERVLDGATVGRRQPAMVVTMFP